MIKAIIFDCFGVLAGDGWLSLKHQYFDDKPELFDRATWLNRQVDTGVISHDTFVHEVAILAGIDPSEARKRINDHVPDETLLNYIRDELKPRYEIGMLSNAGDNWLDDIFSPEQVKLFDAISLSYQMGFAKPDERAYQSVATKLGFELSECVLIEDQERYVTGATEVGMPAIWYKTFAQMKPELEEFLESTSA